MRLRRAFTPCRRLSRGWRRVLPGLKMCGACRGLSLPSADTACGEPRLVCFPCRGRTCAWPAGVCWIGFLGRRGRRCAPERRSLPACTAGSFPAKEQPLRAGKNRAPGEQKVTDPCTVPPSKREAPLRRSRCSPRRQTPGQRAADPDSHLPGAQPRRPTNRHRADPRTVTEAGPAAGRP